MNLVSAMNQPSTMHRATAEERVIDAADVRLEATLSVPPAASGLVALLLASSAGRFAPKSRFAAEVLEQSGLATLQVDLLTPAEEAALPTTDARSRTSLLVGRVLAVVDWLKSQPETTGLRLGLFASAAETAPAALAAARVPNVAAVVSLAGYADSDDAPAERLIPTLLILGREEQARAAELACEFFARQLCQPAT
jgi:putative phosphoribosyl transferase